MSVNLGDEACSESPYDVGSDAKESQFEAAKFSYGLS